MQKVIKDGKVAILYSPGYGAGWSTWNDFEYRETLCMDADIVNAVLEGNLSTAIDIAKKKCPEIYDGGGKDLTVYWLDEGEAFEIREYDGNEGVYVVSKMDYMIA